MRAQKECSKLFDFHDAPEDGCKPETGSSDEDDYAFGRAKALLNDPNYTRTVRTWVKKERQLMPVDKQQRVLPWWRVNADGSYVFFVRLGSKPIEFEKGKNAVAIPSLDKMPLVINILITAVRNGELDEQLAQTKKPATVLKYLKTA